MINEAGFYYEKGWVATINGEDANHFRANYVLRAMRVPVGESIIEFSFKPKTYYNGEKISIASSLILILLALGIFAKEIRRYLKKEEK